MHSAFSRVPTSYRITLLLLLTSLITWLPIAAQSGDALTFEDYLALIGRANEQTRTAQRQPATCSQMLTQVAAELQAVTQVTMPDGAVMAVDHAGAAAIADRPGCRADLMLDYLAGICPARICPVQGPASFPVPSRPGTSADEGAQSSGSTAVSPDSDLPQPGSAPSDTGAVSEPDGTAADPNAANGTDGGSAEAGSAGDEATAADESSAVGDESSGDDATGTGGDEAGEASTGDEAAGNEGGADGGVGDETAVDGSGTGDGDTAGEAADGQAAGGDSGGTAADQDAADIATRAAAAPPATATAIIATATAAAAPAVNPTPTAAAPEDPAADADAVSDRNQTLLIVALVAFSLLLMAVAGWLFWSGGKQEDEAQTRKRKQEQETAVAAGRKELDEGNYREAVRQLFLATLMVLEERGRLRFDRTQTNRELLQAIAPNSDVARHLRPIVNTVERVWYGFEPVSSAEYDALVQRIDLLKRP